MTADRAEWTGVGAALIFHVALIALLSTRLASSDDVPEPPSMEVELVDEVGLEAAAPTPVAQPAASQPPPMPMASEAPPLPQPIETPLPSRPEPTPVARPQPPRLQPAKAQPPKPQQRPAARPTLQRPAPRAQAQRRAGLGEDFLKSFDDDLAPRVGASRSAAPTYSAQARSSVASSIASQAQRCADRQPYLGEGANELKVQVRLSFARSGRLSRPPSIGAITGDSDLRAKYGDLLEDQVRRIFADCAPFRLPTDLYDTDRGGWKETTISYRVSK